MTVSRTIWIALIAFMGGGLIVYFFAPSKIKIQEKEKIVIQRVEVTQVQNNKSEKTKVTKPDGTTIETEKFDHSIMENVVTDHTEASKEATKTITNFNNKRLLIYGGVNPIHTTQFNLGMSYNLFGPLDVGASFDERLYLNIGIRF